MNTPNKLTVTRMILSPVLFCWFFVPNVIKSISPEVYGLVLAGLYLVMELSDLIDGKMARKRGLVTDLGKIMDPFADVICHITFFTCFAVTYVMPVWAFAIIIWRELLQCFVRMLLMGKGTAMPANIFGKSKTVLYAVCTVCGLFYRFLEVSGKVQDWMKTVLTVLFALAAASAVLSFLVYVRNVIKNGTLRNLSR